MFVIARHGITNMLFIARHEYTTLFFLHVTKTSLVICYTSLKQNTIFLARHNVIHVF